MARPLRTFLAIVFALTASAAAASYHTFQIDEIFSNADGTVQYLVLHEAAGLNGQHMLKGHVLASTAGGATTNLVFPKDLPGGSCGYYGCSLARTAVSHVLIATAGF